MTRPVAGILGELFQRTIEVTLADGRIHLKAPSGQMVSHRLQDEVAAHKAEILEVLTKSPSLLDAPLSVFAQCEVALEIYVPGLSDTIWFASGPTQADRLVRDGVRHGRIWTAAQLRDLVTAPGMTHEDAVSIARVKLAFNATVVDIRHPGSRA